MAADLLSDTISTVLGKTLDATVARHKAIANNIANVETPGYKRCYVSFEEELVSAMRQGNPKHVRRAVRELVPLRRTDVLSPSRPDGNNVNIDAEIADLARNSLKNKAVSVLLEARGAMLRAAVSEGKR